MKQILASTVIITSLFLSVFCATPLWAQQTEPKTQEKVVPPLTLPKGDFSEMHKNGISTVVEVINPMTVKLKDGRMVSLAGLDYPDLDFYDPGELAVTAQKVLEDFLTDKKVIIYQTPKSDAGRLNRMGHHIAHLARLDEDGRGDEDSAVWVEGMMFSLGLARARTTKYNNQMASQMLKLEDDARKNKVGLWEMDKYAILSPDQAAKHIGSYQIIEGTIKSISMHKNDLYINFGHDWRKDFTIGISGITARSFSREHIYPRQWNGMDIRVRGWIESYNGPFIELNHIERIELLSTEPVTAPPEETPQATPEDTPITFEGSSLPGYNK